MQVKNDNKKVWRRNIRCQVTMKRFWRDAEYNMEDVFFILKIIVFLLKYIFVLAKLHDYECFKIVPE